MSLPAPLARAIENELAQFDRKALARAVEELSAGYRDMQGGAGPSPKLASTEVQRAAYLLTRLPATYAVVYAVLREIQERIPDLEIRSVLDLGAGPGTAMWAASEIFSELEQVTLIEQSSGFIRVGERLAAASSLMPLQNARWVEANLLREKEFPAHDLVIISYALGEMMPGGREQIVLAAWRATAKAIAVIEPGTPRGFEVILEARTSLLQQKAHLAAPCPHERQCPMDLPGAASSTSHAKRDWCHFAQRLERSSLHRRMKSGELGYEDEKFSYIAAAKQEVARAAARVIRHPIQLKGHIKLELCMPEGLQQKIVTRSQGEAFKIARKVKWGEAWKVCD